MGEAVRIYYTRYFPALALLLFTLGTGISYLLGRGQVSWFEHLQIGVLLMATGWLIGGFVYNAKRLKPSVDLGRADVMIALNKTDQASVRRQITGREPPDQEHLTVVRAAAVQMRKQTATTLLIVPFYLAVIVGSSRWWVAGAMAVVLLVMIFFLVCDFRRQGRFLRKTADLPGQTP